MDNKNSYTEFRFKSSTSPWDITLQGLIWITPLSVTMVSVLLLFGLGFSSISPVPFLNTSDNLYIDPVFREFYIDYGEEFLGAPISPSYKVGNKIFQYFVNGQLVFDSLSPTQESIKLSPLGLKLIIEESPVPPPIDSTEIYIEGQILFAEFANKYFSFGGLDVVGRPLTSVITNKELGRYEQYFSNLGFYRLINEPVGTVHLITYGVLACGSHCQLPVIASPNLAPTEVYSPQFDDAVRRLGGKEFVGDLLSNEFSEDEKQIVIFENIVLYIDEGTNGRVYALPIVKKLGIEQQPPVKRDPDPRMTFYPVIGSLGYNIPIVFRDYFAIHGGMDITGEPITELQEIAPEIYRQCYANLCLEFHNSEPSGSKIRPSKLGRLYLEKIYPDLASQFGSKGSVLSDTGYTVHLTQKYSFLNPLNEQQIFVYALKGIVPQPDLSFSLHITLPFNDLQTVIFPPTDLNGHTSLLIPNRDAPNGTLVPYQVCLQSSLEPVCFSETYIIWNTP